MQWSRYPPRLSWSIAAILPIFCPFQIGCDDDDQPCRYRDSRNSRFFAFFLTGFGWASQRQLGLCHLLSNSLAMITDGPGFNEPQLLRYGFTSNRLTFIVHFGIIFDLYQLVATGRFPEADMTDGIDFLINEIN